MSLLNVGEFFKEIRRRENFIIFIGDKVGMLILVGRMIKVHLY
jgi:hypothetical protein